MEVRVDRGGVPMEADLDDLPEMREPTGHMMDNSKLDEMRNNPRL